MHAFVRNTSLTLLIVLSSTLFAQDQEKSAAKPASSDTKDESTIRANVGAFVKAYNAGDAKAVANLFAPEAQTIDEDGETTQGREAIERKTAATFADAPQGRIQIDVGSIRMIGSALAIETGRANVTSGPGKEPNVSRYTAVHIKSRGGKWLLAFVRETEESEITNAERLKPLEWLVGDWIDESPDSVVMTSCKWSDNKNFLLQDIKIRVQGSDTMHLTQRIGWDPLTKQIRSWLFDSEGGYGESFWTRDGDRWLVKATAVRRDGTTASMTNIYKPAGKDSYTWRMTDRVVGGEVMSPIEIKVVRRPPDAAIEK
ncbi:MAG TPA: SgcJ/EcaC family oxidoreductase [Planctomycetaceae bacterium]|jgi:uncharacterized protein (TIGR02246 family)|nr:SgcJ/EcaC family oxidoreductase [Planctomycetaceae bacterium]